MSEPHIDVSRQPAAQITAATDPDVARILADLAAEDTDVDTDPDAAFERLLREFGDGAGN